MIKPNSADKNERDFIGDSYHTISMDMKAIRRN